MQGLLEGNRMVRDRPDAQLDVIGRAFKWTREDTKAELAKVHLSNLPENRAFFSGAIDAAGSFGGIYQSAVLAYGSDLIKDPPDPSRFVDTKHLEALEKSGLFKEQKIAIAPIRSAGGTSVESDPLLSKDIRFLFEPNSATLDLANQDNIKNLDAIKRMLQVSPGSTMLLRGHVDNAQVADFRRAGRRSVRPHAGAARDGAEQEPRGRDPHACSSSGTASTRSASTSSAAAGKSRRAPTPTRTGASKCSGSRSNENFVASALGT